MIKKMTVWGREFNLDVEFDYYDEPLPLHMLEAVDALVASPDSIECALPQVIQYCIEHNGDELLAISRTDGVDNIFRYVMPQYLYALESDGEEAVNHRVALMCDYRFDPEEGLALLFEDEELVEILPQSSVM